MPFFCVAYGTTIRWEKAKSESEAAKLAYGLVDTNRMTVKQFPANPKYMPRKKIDAVQAELCKRHEEKTGNKILN
jgi:hypothetical protein